MLTTRTTARILSLLPLSLIAACGNAVDVDSLQDNVARHRALWDQAGVGSYRFDFLRSCLCQGIEPVTIEVTNDIIVSVINRNTEEILPTEEFTFYVTVDDLFDAVQDAIQQHVYSVEASFDPVLGYPTRILIDPGRFVSHDEVTMLTSSLQPL